MIKLVEIEKIYTSAAIGFHALKNINLQFRKNEFVTILGKSGCGKTTLLNILGGIDTPTSGNIAVGNKLISKFNEEERNYYRNHQIGFIFQSFNLIDHLTVLENVCLQSNLGGKNNAETTKKALELLRRVNLERHQSKYPNQLSGGERQRVAIARALINDPEIILADEPTGNLDKKNSREIMELIKEFGKDRLVIMVTHNKKLADMYATRQILMQDGRVIEDSNSIDEKVDIVFKSNLNIKHLGLWKSIKYSFKSLLTRKFRSLLLILALGFSVGIITTIDGAFNSVRKSQETSYEKTSYLEIYSKYIEDDSILKMANKILEYDEVSEVLIIPNKEFQAKSDQLNELYTLPLYPKMESDFVIRKFKDIYGELPKNNNEITLSLQSAINLFNLKYSTTASEAYELLKNQSIKILSKEIYSYDINSLDQSQCYSGSSIESINYPYYLGSKQESIDYAMNLFGEVFTDPNSVENRYYLCGTNYYNEYLYLNNFPKSEEKSTYKEIKIVGILGNQPLNYDLISKNFFEEYILENQNEKEFYATYHVFIHPNKTENFNELVMDIENDLGVFVRIVRFKDTVSSGFSEILSVILQFTFTAISTIAIITSVLMMILILNINVLERRKEIGIIRGIGGSKRDVTSIFTSETMLIGIFAGISSIIFSLAFMVFANIFIPKYQPEWFIENFGILNIDKPISLSFATLLLGFMISIFVATSAGFFPSKQAAKKDPIKSIREE